MRAFTFDDLALAKIAQRKQAKSRLYIVFGYQFKSEFYDSDVLKKSIDARISKLQNLLADTASFEISMEFRPLKAGLGMHIMEEIITDIASADIAIFEVSDKNPNVFLEMGVALSHGVAIIPLKHKNSDAIPSDISGLVWVTYEENGNTILDDNFDYDLQTLISRVLKKKAALRD